MKKKCGNEKQDDRCISFVRKSVCWGIVINPCADHVSNGSNDQGIGEGEGKNKQFFLPDGFNRINIPKKAWQEAKHKNQIDSLK